MTATIANVDETGLPESIRMLQSAIDEAGVVIFPTETVYGLAARADMLGAVDRLFEIKMRPSSNPLPIMVGDKNKVYDISVGLDDRFERLAEYFWPGPLTIVVSKNEIIDPTVTAGLRSVAVRVPSHEVAFGLLNTVPLPLAVTSANLSGDEIIGDAELVDIFKDKVDVIILGDTCRYGQPSTIIDLTSRIPAILRHGAIERERIEAALRGLCEIC